MLSCDLIVAIGKVQEMQIHIKLRDCLVLRKWFIASLLIVKTALLRTKKKGEKVAFFGFLINNFLRRVRVQKVKRKNWTPSESSKLCSCNFEEYCFVISPATIISMGWTRTRLSLKSNAIPTIFDYGDSNNQSTESTKRKEPRAAFRKRRRLEISRAIWNNYL